MTPIAAIALLAAAQAAVQPSTASAPATAPAVAPTSSVVTVTGRRPVVVTATDWCPEPQPARYPATSDPRVVDSFPHRGASVAPGLAQVRVTFDAPMSCYAEVTSEGGEQDPCEPRGVWTLPDRRSFLLQCRLTPGVAYVFRFRRDEGRGFVGLSGRDAEPFVLRFATTDAPAVASWAEAKAADPGPPDAVAPRAYVTCDDISPSQRNGDCSHQRLGAPPPP